MKYWLVILLLFLSACQSNTRYDNYALEIDTQENYKQIDHQKYTSTYPTLEYVATSNNGILMIFDTEGFHDGLIIGVEINTASNAISQVKILAHQETIDYGGVVDQGWFTQKYHQQSINKPTNTVRYMSKNEDDIVAMTGATITSQAINHIINQAKELALMLKEER